MERHVVGFGVTGMANLGTDTMAMVATGSEELTCWLDGLRRIDPALAGRADCTPVIVGADFLATTGVDGRSLLWMGSAWFRDPRPHLRAYVHEMSRALLGVAGDLAVEAGDAILQAVLTADARRYWILRSLVDLAARGDVSAVEGALRMDLREAYARAGVTPWWECADAEVRERLVRESEPHRFVLACVEGMRMGEEWWIRVAGLLTGDRNGGGRQAAVGGWRMRASVA